MAEEESGRPQRKKTGGRVIYRECDSDDEDYETFTLIRYLDVRSRAGLERRGGKRYTYRFILIQILKDERLR